MTAREQSSCFTSRKVVRHHKTYNSGCRLDKLAEETMRILRVGHYRFLSSSSPSTVNLDKARLATSYISCKTIVVDTAAKSTAKACKNKRRIVPRRRTNGSRGIPLSVVVVEEDSFDAALAATKDSSKAPCVLDFASDTCPGGGWRTKQQGTQEESLCRRSSLGESQSVNLKAIAHLIVSSQLPPRLFLYIQGYASRTITNEVVTQSSCRQMESCIAPRLRSFAVGRASCSRSQSGWPW